MRMDRRLWAVVLVVPFGGFGVGCSTSRDRLFPENSSRSPYERYLTLRDRDRSATVTDAFGRDQPNLRERLRPLDQP